MYFQSGNRFTARPYEDKLCMSITEPDYSPLMVPLGSRVLHGGFLYVGDHAIGNFQADELLADFDDLAHLTAAGDDFIALLQRFKHAAQVFGTASSAGG